MASIEEYMEEMRKEAASRPPPKLKEHPHKYTKNAGNCPTFSSIQRYDPTDPKNVKVAATIQGHLDRLAEQKKK